MTECPRCGSRAITLSAGRYLCIECNHTWTPTASGKYEVDPGAIEDELDYEPEDNLWEYVH